MKIVHAISTIDPAAGGPPLVVVRIAAAQSALGHAVSVLSYFDEAASSRIQQSILKVPCIDKVKFEFVPRRGFSEKLWGNQARERIRQLLIGADWLHCHGVWERLIEVSANEAFEAGIPYCIRPAGMLDPWSLSQKRIKKRIALALGYRSMLNRAAFIHALNADEENLLKPLLLSAPSEVIPNGIFLEEFSPLPEPGTFRKHVPAIGASKYVLFLARLHKKKGLDFLVDSFDIVAAEDSDIKLVVAGPDDGHAGWLEKRIRQSRYGSRISVVGPLYGSLKVAALVDCEVFCLPSRQEGFSVAALEALSCGAPVVISRPSNFPEIGEVNAGIVVELDSHEIANAILKVSSDRAKRQQMSQAARRLVATRYLWAGIGCQIIEKYERYLTA